MKLRNGKLTVTGLKKDKNDHVSEYLDNLSEISDQTSEYVPTESSESSFSVGSDQNCEFTDKIMLLLHYLSETSDLSRRLYIILDIYTYLDNHDVELANKAKFAHFIKIIREKSLNLYKELAVTAMKHGKYIWLQDLILLISTNIISVLAKIGE